MLKLRLCLIILYAFVCQFYLSTAAAGVIINADIKDLRTTPPTPYTARIYLQDERIKISTARSHRKRRKIELLYFGKKETLYYIDHSRKEIIRLEEQNLIALSSQFKMALDFLGSQVVRRSPVTTAALSPRVRALDKKMKLSGFNCRKYEIYQNNRKIQSLWAAPWSSAGINAKSRGSLLHLAGSYDRVMNALAGMPLVENIEYVPLKGLISVDKYPVSVTQFRNQKPAVHLFLSAPKKAHLPADSFSLPAGYANIGLPF